MSVPSNLIPTTITQLPEAPVASPSGYFPIVIAGTTYKVQFSQISANVTVPPSRRVNAGTGLTGGGTLSADITIAVESGGITDTQLNTTGVTAGTYGSDTAIPVITVSAKGRVTNVSTASLSISGYVPNTRTITAGNGLTGGGNLAADRSFAVNYSSATPQSVGSATVGTSVQLSRGDHVHPAINLSDSTQTSGTLGVSKGGTGNAIVPVPGALIYSNGTYLDQTDQGFSGAVLQANGTAAPTWVSPSTLVVARAANISGGAANRIAYQTAPNTTGFLTAPTVTDTFLKWNGTAFVWAASSAGGTVTSVDGSGGTTGLTLTGGPITSAGTLSLGGTLSVSSGGTGLGATPTNGQLLIGDGAGFTLSTLTAGSGIGITNATGSITIAYTGAGGDVVGPASSTVNAVARFDGTTGQLIKDTSDFIIDNSNRITIGGSASPDTKMNFTGTAPVSANYSYGIANRMNVPSGAGSAAYAFYSEANGSGTVPWFHHFYAAPGASVGNITTRYGFNVNDGLLTTGNIYGVHSDIKTAVGYTRFSVYAPGTAPNYFAGNTLIGGTNGGAVATEALEITAGSKFRLNGATSGYTTLKAPTTGNNIDYTLPSADGANGYVLSTNGSGVLSWAAAASGDVVGPAGATSTAVALFDGGTGKLLKNSAVTISSTGVISGVASPEANTDAANKLYVDGLVSTGLTFHDPVQLATTSAFTGYSITYNNGSSGVSATITQASSYSSLTIDSTAAAVNNRILVKDAANAAYNGVYYVTSTGSGATPWVLTRTSDADTYGPSVGQLSRNDYFFTQNGVANKGAAFVCTTSGTITFGTTGITFTEFSNSQVYTVGNGLSLTGTTISLNTPVSVLNGGTGLSSAASNGQLPIGNGAGFTLSTLSTGTGISVTNATGSISIANTAPDQTVTLTGSTAISVTGTYPSFTLTNTAPDKTVILTGAGGASISGTYPSFTITSTAGTVTSVDGSSTISGVTLSGGPITSSGRLTIAGTVGVSGGGTGLTSTPTNGQLDIGNGTGFTRTTLTAGSGISITNGTGSITIAATSAGTVTSVDASTTVSGFSITGGPVTTSGLLTLAGTLNISNGGTGSGTASGARTALGLGTMATQDASSVVITGGSIGASVLVNLGNATGTISGGTY